MNWLQLTGIVGIVLLIAINGVVYGLPRLRKWRASLPAPVATVDHDAGAPAGGVEWVKRIVAAAGSKATPDFVLKHLNQGATPAQVMADRIAQMEAGAPEVVSK
jgi:hypothetical protein